MRMTKAVSLITLACFLFSSVFNGALEAIVDNNDRVRYFEEILNEFVIPASLGRITDARYCGSGTVVVNIQDLHCHPEVQRNISRMLSILDRQYGLKKVYVEGASGELDTSWLSDFKDRSIRKEIVDALVDDGRLTGTEHFSIMSNRPDVLVGLEDDAVYRANLLRLDRILGKQEEFNRILGTLRQDLDGIKGRYFSDGNRKFDELVAGYRDSELDPAKYYTLLRKYAEALNLRSDNGSVIDLARYPTVAAYLSLMEAGERLRYKSIARQLQEFMALLKLKLPYRAYNFLMERTDNFSRLDELYIYLSRISREFGVTFDVRHRQLKEFFDYMEKSQKINPLVLLREERRLIEEIRTGLSEDVGELEVSFLADFFNYFADYLGNRLSAEDYAYFEERFGEFKLLWAKYAATNRLNELEGDLPLLEEYYRVNLERNGHFIRHLLGGRKGGTSAGIAAPKPSNDIAKTVQSLGRADEVAVVVTGGFHTEGLKQLLAERNVSYLSITPNVTKNTDEADLVYRQIARQQARILSEMLAPMLTSMLVNLLGRAGEAERPRLACMVFRDVLEAMAAHSNDIETRGNELREVAQKLFNVQLDERQFQIVKGTAGKQARVVFPISESDAAAAAVFEISGSGEVRLVSPDLPQVNIPRAEIKGRRQEGTVRTLMEEGLTALESALVWHLWLAAPLSLNVPRWYGQTLGRRSAGEMPFSDLLPDVETLVHGLGRKVLAVTSPAPRDREPERTEAVIENPRYVPLAVSKLDENGGKALLTLVADPELLRATKRKWVSIGDRYIRWKKLRRPGTREYARLRKLVTTHNRLIEANFAALRMIGESADALSRETLAAIAEQVDIMAAEYFRLAALPAEERAAIERKWKTLKDEMSAYSNTALAAKETRDRILSLTPRERIDDIRTVHELINYLHQKSFEPLFAGGAGEGLATDRIDFNGRALSFINIGKTPLVRDSSVSSDLAALLLRGLDGETRGTTDQQVVLQDDWMVVNIRLGHHSAALHVRLLPADRGGVIDVRYMGSTEETDQQYRNLLLKKVMEGLGLTAEIKNDYLHFRFDKTVARRGDTPDEIRTILPYVVRVLYSVADLDINLQQVVTLLYSVFLHKDEDEILEEAINSYVDMFLEDIGWQAHAGEKGPALDADRERINRRLAELELPPVPDGVRLTQANLDRYVNDPIRGKMARGEIAVRELMPGEREGAPREKLEQASAYRPVDDMLAAISGKEAKEMARAAQAIAPLVSSLSPVPEGFVGKLLLQTGMMEIPGGAPLVVILLTDTGTDDVVFARVTRRGVPVALSVAEVRKAVRDSGLMPGGEGAVSARELQRRRAKLHEPWSEPVKGVAVLRGLPSAPGVKRGTITHQLIIPAEQIHDKIKQAERKGQILVLDHADPGDVEYIPGFGGLVTARGSFMSHAAITVRELGMPSAIIPSLPREGGAEAGWSFYSYSPGVAFPRGPHGYVIRKANKRIITIKEGMPAILDGNTGTLYLELASGALEAIPSRSGLTVQRESPGRARSVPGVRRTEWVLRLSDLGREHYPSAGAKGANLGELAKLQQSLGFNVPDGFVVTTEAFDAFVREAGIGPQIEKLLSERERDDIGTQWAVEQLFSLALGRAGFDLRAKIDAFVKLSAGADTRYAVRSSNADEDTADAAFAGLGETALYVPADGVFEQVVRNFASFATTRALRYRAARGLERKMTPGAVVVQQMVDAEAAGVMFTRDPRTGDGSRIVISASYGLGDAIVGGIVTPDEYALAKRNGEEIGARVEKKEKMAVRKRGEISGTTLVEVPVTKQSRRALTRQQVRELGIIGRELERHYGHPVDVEFAVKGGEIYVLQVRPVTTGVSPLPGDAGSPTVFSLAGGAVARLPGFPVPVVASSGDSGEVTIVPGPGVRDLADAVAREIGAFQGGAERTLAVRYRFARWLAGNREASGEERSRVFDELMEEQEKKEESERLAARAPKKTVSAADREEARRQQEAIGKLFEATRKSLIGEGDPSIFELAEQLNLLPPEGVAAAFVEFARQNKDGLTTEGKARDSPLTRHLVLELEQRNIVPLLLALYRAALRSSDAEEGGHFLGLMRLVIGNVRFFDEGTLRDLFDEVRKGLPVEFRERVSVRRRDLPPQILATLSAYFDEPVYDTLYFKDNFLQSIVWLRDPVLIGKLQTLYREAHFGQRVVLETLQAMLKVDRQHETMEFLLDNLERNDMPLEAKSALMALIASAWDDRLSASVEVPFVDALWDTYARTLFPGSLDDIIDSLAQVSSRVGSLKAKQTIAAFIVGDMNMLAKEINKINRQLTEAHERTSAPGKSDPASARRERLGDAASYGSSLQSLMERMEKRVGILFNVVSHSLATNDPEQWSFAADLLGELITVAENNTWGRDAAAEIVSHLGMLVPSHGGLVIPPLVRQLYPGDASFAHRVADILMNEPADETLLKLLRELNAAPSPANERTAYLIILARRDSVPFLEQVVRDPGLNERQHIYAFVWLSRRLAEVEANKSGGGTPVRRTELGDHVERLSLEAQRLIEDLKGGDVEFLQNLVQNPWLQDEEAKMHEMAVLLAMGDRVRDIGVGGFFTVVSHITGTKVLPYLNNAFVLDTIVLGGRMIQRSASILFQIIAHELGHTLLKGAHGFSASDLKTGILHELVADLEALVISEELHLESGDFFAGLDFAAIYNDVAQDNFFTVECHEGARALLTMVRDVHAAVAEENPSFPAAPAWHILRVAALKVVMDGRYANRNFEHAALAIVNEYINDLVASSRGQRLDDAKRMIDRFNEKVSGEKGRLKESEAGRHDIEKIKTSLPYPAVLQSVFRLYSALADGSAAMSLSFLGESGVPRPAGILQDARGRARSDIQGELEELFRQARELMISSLSRSDVGLIGKLFDAGGSRVTKGARAIAEGELIYFRRGDRPLYTKDKMAARVRLTGATLSGKELAEVFGKEGEIYSWAIPIGFRRYIEDFLATARGRNVVMIEDNENIGGFHDGENVFLSGRLARSRIALFHELGEGYFAARPGQLPPGVNAHTYLRGCGKEVRELAARDPQRFIRRPGVRAGAFLRSLRSFLIENLPEGRYNEAELALIAHNLEQGKNGAALLAGLQETVFGEEGATLPEADPGEAADGYRYDYRKPGGGASAVPRLFVNGQPAPFIGTEGNSHLFSHPFDPAMIVYVEKEADPRFHQRFNLLAGPKGSPKMAGWQGDSIFDVPAGPAVYHSGRTNDSRYVVASAIAGETFEQSVNRMREAERRDGVSRSSADEFELVLRLLERLITNGIFVDNFNPGNVAIGRLPHGKVDRAYLIDASRAERQPFSRDIINGYLGQVRNWKGFSGSMLGEYLYTMLQTPDWFKAMGGRRRARGAITPWQASVAAVVTLGVSAGISLVTGQQIPWETLLIPSFPFVVIGGLALAGWVVKAAGIRAGPGFRPDHRAGSFLTLASPDPSVFLFKVVNGTLKVNPSVHAFLLLLPPWLQNAILFAPGIGAHESLHLKGFGEVFAYTVAQGVPALGGFLLGGVLAAMGAPAAAAVLGGIVTVGALAWVAGAAAMRGIERFLPEETLERAARALYAERKPEFLWLIEARGYDFSAFAARALKLSTFEARVTASNGTSVLPLDFTLNELLPRSDETLNEYRRMLSDAIADIVDFSEEYDRNPKARRFVDALAALQAMNDAKEATAARELPADGQGKGEYWDLASGTNFAGFMKTLEPGHAYRAFDLSPFVITYLRKRAALLGIDNLSLERKDVTTLKRPAAPLRVIRVKNVSTYVDRFAAKLREMADWLPAGGKLVLQTDGTQGQRDSLVRDLGGLVAELIGNGWLFEHQVASEEIPFDTLILTKPDGRAALPAQSLAAWEEYREVVARNITEAIERFLAGVRKDALTQEALDSYERYTESRDRDGGVTDENIGELFAALDFALRALRALADERRSADVSSLVPLFAELESIPLARDRSGATARLLDFLQSNPLITRANRAALEERLEEVNDMNERTELSVRLISHEPSGYEVKIPLTVFHGNMQMFERQNIEIKPVSELHDLVMNKMFGLLRTVETRVEARKEGRYDRALPIMTAAEKALWRYLLYRIVSYKGTLGEAEGLAAGNERAGRFLATVKDVFEGKIVPLFENDLLRVVEGNLPSVEFGVKEAWEMAYENAIADLKLKSEITDKNEAIKQQLYRAIQPEPCDEQLTMRGDPRRMRDLFTTLIKNSYQIGVTERNMASIRVSVALEKHGGVQVLTYRDNAGGAGRELLEPVRPGSGRQNITGMSASQRQGGSGFGFAYVWHIADSLGGTLTVGNVTDDEGEPSGIHVTMSVPAGEKARAEAALAQLGQEVVSPGKRLIIKGPAAAPARSDDAKPAEEPSPAIRPLAAAAAGAVTLGAGVLLGAAFYLITGRPPDVSMVALLAAPLTPFALLGGFLLSRLRAIRAGPGARPLPFHGSVSLEPAEGVPFIEPRPGTNTVAVNPHVFTIFSWLHALHPAALRLLLLSSGIAGHEAFHILPSRHRGSEPRAYAFAQIAPALLGAAAIGGAAFIAGITGMALIAAAGAGALIGVTLAGLILLRMLPEPAPYPVMRGGADEMRGMAYRGTTGEPYHYPIYQLPDGKKVIKKYAEDSRLDFFSLAFDANFAKRPFSARAAYLVARALGFAGVNRVDVYLGGPLAAASLEGYFGESLEEVYDAGKVAALSSELEGEEVGGSVYDFFADKKSFVAGDVYRLFSDNFDDSAYGSNVRVERGSEEFRWIDYGYSFTAQPAESYEKMARYMRDHAYYFFEYARPLIEAIAGLEDGAIERIGEEVFGAAAREAVVEKLRQEMAGRSEAETRNRVNGMFEQAQEEYLGEIRKRRAIFREFVEWSKTAALSHPRRSAGKPSIDAIAELVHGANPLTLRIIKLLSEYSAAYHTISPEIRRLRREMPEVYRKTVYWFAKGPEDVAAMARKIRLARREKGLSGLVVSGERKIIEDRYAGDKIEIGKITVPGRAGEAAKVVNVWAVAEAVGKKEFDEFRSVTKIENPVVVIYLEDNPGVAQGDWQRLARLKAVALLANDGKVARGNIARLYRRWGIWTGGMDITGILDAGAIVGMDDGTLEQANGEELIDLRGHANGKKWEMLNRVAVVGADQSFNVIAGKIRNKTLESYEKGYDVIARLLTGGAMLSEEQARRLALVVKEARGSNIRLSGLALDESKREAAKKILWVMHDEGMKVHFDSRVGELTEAKAREILSLLRKDGGEGFDGVELDMSGLAPAEAEAMARWLNRIGKERPSTYVTVVLPEGVSRAGMKRLLADNISIAVDTVAGREVRGESRECVRLSLGGVAGDLGRLIEIIDAGVIEVTLNELAGAGEGDGRDMFGPNGVASIIGNLTALMRKMGESPEVGYRMAWKYLPKDIPGTEALTALVGVMRRYGINSYLRGEGTLEGFVGGVDVRALAGEAQRLMPGDGPVQQRLRTLAEGALPGNRDEAAKLVRFMVGISERMLVQAALERDGRSGFLEEWQEREYGRALLARMVFIGGEADSAGYFDTLQEEWARSPAVATAVKQAAEGGIGRYVKAKEEERGEVIESMKKDIERLRNAGALRGYLVTLRERDALSYADFIDLLSFGAQEAKELAGSAADPSTKSEALGEYLRILDLLSDLKETLGVEREMRNLLDTQGVYALLGAA